MIAELVEMYGIENVKVTVKSAPVRSLFGIYYTSSDDKEVENEHSLIERRYRISDRYKVEFEPVVIDGVMYSPHSMYISDLEQSIRHGQAAVRVTIPEEIA